MQSSMNYYIERMLAETVSFSNSKSILANLTELKQEYCKRNRGGIAVFDAYAEAFLGSLIRKQLDGAGLYRAIVSSRGTDIVDPAIENLMKNAIYFNKKKVIELFEESYNGNRRFQDNEKGKRFFILELKHPYFSDIELYPHFYERLKEPKAYA